MRIESSVTSVTWIPSEAIEGMPKLPFELGLTHYDDPPPDVIEDLNALRDSDSFREANELGAWIEVRGGKIVDYAYRGRGMIGVTRVKLGPKTIAFPAVKYPLLQAEPEVTDQWVRFEQTAGGRMGLPAPRRVRGKPYFQLASASAWTTLSLIIYADGTSKHSLVGASPFPRHWIYDRDGRLVEKSGVVDFQTWWRESYGLNTPWGDEDSPALVTAVESELERALSSAIMRSDEKLSRRRLEPGETLVEQGQPGDELYLLLDGFLAVEVDGEAITEIGPGAILGEGASLGDGRRTATLRAMVPCRVAPIPANLVEWHELEAIAAGRRE
jgi:hypothetical protein